jgi:hypothetical protein
MPQIDIHQLAEFVIAKIPANTPVEISLPEHKNGGLHFRIDGVKGASSIGVWSNGYCDIEYIQTDSEEITAHHEFSSLSDAVETIVAELQQALERAGFTERV